MRLFNFSFLIAGLGLSLTAQADLKSFRYEQLRANELNSNFVEHITSTKTGTFDQKIDPTGKKNTQTFKQRYFLNSDYADGPDSPVLYVICGEAACSEGNLEGAVDTYARALKAHRVTLEHRYYGKSQPFATLSAPSLKYLTTDNAISDLATFQKFAMREFNLKGKWISIGGSYSGSLSAYYRLKHPKLVVGALASSAPVRAAANFEAYDLDVATVAGPECAQAMRSVVKEVEGALKNPSQMATYKNLFKASDVKSNIDFLYVIADMAAVAVQYGHKDEFCYELTQDKNLVTNYASAGSKAFEMFGITPFQDSFQGALSENPDDYLSGFGARSWFYQTCSEYGYWQVAYHDPAISVRSSLINLSYHNETCKKFFGVAPVNTDKINHSYYAPLLTSQASQILFTDGSTDPWSKLSLTQELGNATNPLDFFYTILGAAHADDLGTPQSRDSSSLRDARQLFLKLAAEWLK